MSLAQKLISKAASRDFVNVGEVVTAKVDLAMMHDSGGPRRVEPILNDLRASLFDPSKIVVISDHFVSSGTGSGDKILSLTRNWVSKNKTTFYDTEGICHVVLPNKGHLRPGMFVVGGDSHSTTGGAFGTYMFGIGSTEMAGVLATGEIWVTVPNTILLNWNGKLSHGVMAKDIMLYLCRTLGMDGGKYQAIEFKGSAIENLSINERMTLSNMCAELGAQVGLIAPDNKIANFLVEKGIDPGEWEKYFTDENTKGIEKHDFNANTLEPQVAKPHSPSNSLSVNSIENTKIEVAYIGACTGAKYEDLRIAAKILKNKKIHKEVKLLVAPASKEDQEKATNKGFMKILEDSGAKVLPNSCGICAGYGNHRLDPDIKCISSTARNFKGRMGDKSSQVWLASPATVAATAIKGYIIDPRNFLEEN